MRGGRIRVIACGAPSCGQVYDWAQGHDCPGDPPRRPVPGVPYRPPVDSGLGRKDHPGR
jgi:hypothetical protein